MRGQVRWILLVLLLGALIAIFVAVPINGRTLLERIGGPAKEAPARTPAQSPARPRPANHPADRLTEKDRQGLDRLIESKLDKAEEEGGRKLPPKK